MRGLLMRASAATTSRVQLDSPRLTISATALSMICSRRFSGDMRCARFLTGMDLRAPHVNSSQNHSTPCQSRLSQPDSRPLAAIAEGNSLERRVLKILQMVETGSTFAIRDLAAELRLSPAYLQRLFKRETGICMGEWLSEQRLRRAAYLLSNSFLSIKEIPYAIGCEHTSS